MSDENKTQPAAVSATESEVSAAAEQLMASPEPAAISQSAEGRLAAVASEFSEQIFADAADHLKTFGLKEDQVTEVKGKLTNSIHQAAHRLVQSHLAAEQMAASTEVASEQSVAAEPLVAAEPAEPSPQAAELAFASSEVARAFAAELSDRIGAAGFALGAPELSDRVASPETLPPA